MLGSFSYYKAMLSHIMIFLNIINQQNEVEVEY